MVHKFAIKGGYAQALSKKTRDFYDSPTYKRCAWIIPPLPPSASRHINFLIGELVDYRDQILNIIEVEKAMMDERPGNVNVFTAFLVTQLTLFSSFDNPCFLNELERLAPRLMAWFEWFSGTKLALSQSMQERMNDYRRSRSIFDRTPAEAVRIFKAHPKLRPCPPGSIAVHFYSSFEKGKGLTLDPDYITDLYVDPSKGVHLRQLCDKLGAESLAVITDKEPFRTVFVTADQDWLSPIATLDLTKEFREPLRVFEHRVTQSTKIKRIVRVPCYHAVVFIVTLFQLLFGFPEQDSAYMSVLYGSRYARMYASIGPITTNLNRITVRSIRFIAHCVQFCCIVVPCAALFILLHSAFRTIRFVALSTPNIVRPLVSSLSSTVYCAEAALSFVSTLDTKAWLVIFGMLWLGFAEFYSLAA